MSENKVEHVIIAPHYDDEIIGNFEVLMNPIIKPIIVYLQDDPERQKEALTLKKHIDTIQVQLFQKSLPPVVINPTNILYFPDPVFETHPMHRKWGAVGEDYLRKGFNVIFYSTNMTAPYVHEVSDFKGKRRLLEKVYPSQKSLFKFENKYFLFEGRYRWIM